MVRSVTTLASILRLARVPADVGQGIDRPAGALIGTFNSRLQSVQTATRGKPGQTLLLQGTVRPDMCREQIVPRREAPTVAPPHEFQLLWEKDSVSLTSLRHNS
jgi:hypothetical protein